MKKIILIPSYEPDNKLIELLENINKEIDIVVVDDGSGDGYDKIFDKLKEYSHVISYKENIGKGHALKEGFKYIKSNYKDDYIVVTMDSDGQHSIKDACRIFDYVNKNLDTLVLGKRTWDNTTPKRSRFGNSLTRKIYKHETGLEIYDTQTGLRGFSYKLMNYMLNIEGERYEYEMNVLLNLKNKNIKFKELDIETIYFDNNKGSHYSTLKDSYKIYKGIKKWKKSNIK